jgi:hypothetical protein
MFEPLVYFLLGSIGGLIVASWHGYKDPPWEGFVLKRFPRSIITAGVIGLLLYLSENLGLLNKIDNLGVIVLSAITLERFAGEIRKGFLKKKIHSEFEDVFVKYKIPIYYKSFLIRILMGLVFFIIVSLILIFFVKLPDYLLGYQTNKLLLGASLGFLGGLSSAVAGAWKDSPSEGFLFKKFVRSIIAGPIGGIILALVSNSFQLFIIASMGFERITVEFYKTFWTKSPRGMFKGIKPKYPEWLKKRYIFFISYSVGVIILALLLVLT